MQWWIYTTLLLICSNLFMTTAWYGHLKYCKNSSIVIAILISWGIALFEYMLQVPANRIGFQKAMLTLGQLKIMQEAIALLVFIPFALFFMREPLTWNYLWATLCILMAVFFIFQ